MIRGIAFDLFDTLVDQDHERLPSVEIHGRRVSPSTPDLYRHAQEQTGLTLTLGEFSELQRDVDRELFRKTLKRGRELPTRQRFEALAKRLELSDEFRLADAWTRIHMEMLRRAITVPEHHEAILASLAVEYPLALCSNFSHAETARTLLGDAGFAPHLASVVISEEVGIRKPGPEIFEAVAVGLGFAPGEILHVGDSLLADVAGAHAFGMKTVWLTRQIADPERQLRAYHGPAPDFALEDLIDLPVLLARLAI